MAAKGGGGLGNAPFGGILVVVTVSADQFASFVKFECPCDRSLNQEHGFPREEHVEFVRLFSLSECTF